MIKVISDSHIKGIWKTRGQTQSSSTTYTGKGYRWVKIKGAEYRLK
jgi:hypothetical protein